VLFQFLIGTLRTGKQEANPGETFRVSIPHR